MWKVIKNDPRTSVEKIFILNFHQKVMILTKKKIFKNSNPKVKFVNRYSPK